MATEAPRQTALPDLVRARAPADVDGVEVLSDPRQRLPHVVTLSFPHRTGEPLRDELARAGLAPWADRRAARTR